MGQIGLGWESMKQGAQNLLHTKKNPEEHGMYQTGTTKTTGWQGEQSQYGYGTTQK